VTAPAEVQVVGPPQETSARSARGETTELEIVLREGRKRQVRLMCRAVGHPVLGLRRVSVGGIALAGLQMGRWRRLSQVEVRSLRTQTDSGDGDSH